MRKLTLAPSPMAAHALLQSGLRPINSLCSVGDAYAAIGPIFQEAFPDRGAYRSPDSLADTLLGSNYKLSKTIDGIDAEIRGLSLLPAGLSGAQFCVGRSADCERACLNTTGHAALTGNQAIRLVRSIALLEFPREFVTLLDHAIGRFARRCKGKRSCLVRLNVVSDLPWETIAPMFFDRHPTVQFYDYTKIEGRSTPENYHLTFSFSGRNTSQSTREIDRGHNVAVVFAESLPSHYMGLPVIDGDRSDLRPLDPPASIVGLTFKRPAGVPIGSVGSFVVRDHLTQGGQ